MQRTFTVGFDAKGKIKRVIHDLDVSEKEQKIYFQSAKVGALPKEFASIGVCRLEKTTTGIDQSAQNARLKADVTPEAKPEA